MSDEIETKADSAEKAYAAAAEKAAPAKPAEEAKPSVKATSIAAPKPVKKPLAAKPKAAPVKMTVAKTAPAKPAVKAAKPILPKPPKSKENPMSKTPDFMKSMTDAMSDTQAKLKAAYEKSTALASEATEFAKGNVEAAVEAGKIFGAGFQDLGKTYVDEAKSAFETMTADLKEIAAIKSPTELFQLQGKLARRNFDSMIAFGSKSSEAMVKLANDTMAPLSSRMSLAADTLAKVA